MTVRADPRVAHAWRIAGRAGGSLPAVSPIALRARARRCRRHAAALALMLALVGAVAVHHAAPAFDDPQHGPGLPAAAEMCLGVFTAAVAFVVALGIIAVDRFAPAMSLTPSGPLLRAARPPELRARAGPGLRSLLCISRR